ncbi:MAG: hypothetical protein WBG90_12705 [Saonia sp.]
MLRLKINKLSYSIKSIDGCSYGAEIPFKDGLNIIYGPNSVGKTSIITGIIYGLGAEKGLGVFKSIQNPFKPEFYKMIDGKEIQTSYLLLEISNGEETVTIFRYIKGGDINIAAVKNCISKEFFKTEELEKFIVVGEGVFSDNGFQSFLFNFLGLPEVKLPTYDKKFSKLYFENILPLFFVEQRAGWSQIQARQVSRYGIKDIKKVAFEYLIGLDKFKVHQSEIKLKEIASELKDVEDELFKKEDNLLIIANAEKIDDIPIVSTRDIGKTSIYDYINYLKNKYKIESKFINSLSSQNKEFEDSNIRIRDNIKMFDFQYRKLSQRIESINTELSGYENYLERIKINKYKNKQLRKIKEFSADINIKSCPVCETKLTSVSEGECILCHSDLTKTISTPEQNLSFLEDEERTFKKVIAQRVLDKRKMVEQRTQIKEKIKTFETQLEHQTTTYAGKEFAKLREKILEVDAIHKELQRYSRVSLRWEELQPLRDKIKKLSAKFSKLKKQIEEHNQTKNDIKILNTIKSFIRSNVQELGLFKSNSSLINGIKIDASDNYTPYLDNFDIYNISSSSDNIRIILSYYLALLQTSIKLKNNSAIKFPNLLILDEPKQQNLDNDSLIDCVNLIDNLAKSESQVILTTYSELEADRIKFDEHIVYEMKNKKDYLLKEINNE